MYQFPAAGCVLLSEVLHSFSPIKKERLNLVEVLLIVEDFSRIFLSGEEFVLDEQKAFLLCNRKFSPIKVSLV